MTRMIHSAYHHEIKDWPKRPYKTIAIVKINELIQVILLLISGIIFVSVGYYKFMTDHTYDIYVPYIILGIMLLIPGLFYFVILVFIIIGIEGYEYNSLPDLSDT